MRILNIHKRTVNQPKNEIVSLLKTLSTENDKIWPFEKWPAMEFIGGIQKGAKGGHGPIRYSVEKYNPNEIVQFRISRPIGFNGIHKFEINELTSEKTEIKYSLEMNTTVKGSLIWILVVRHTHEALAKDALDKLQNNFSKNRKSSDWSIWVKVIRKLFILAKGRSKPTE